MNLSIASHELWFRTRSFSVCPLLIQHFVACQTAECPVTRKFIEQRHFLVFTYHRKNADGAANWHTDYTNPMEDQSPHLALPHVCCYVFKLPPWSLCSSPNGAPAPPRSLNIFPNLPVQEICAYFVHFALNTIVLDKFLVHFPA